MTISVTDDGTANGFSGSTLTASGLTIPVGALALVATVEFATTSGSITDSAGNTWTKSAQAFSGNSSGNGTGALFWSLISNPLSSGGITYTRHGSGNSAAMSILHAVAPSGWVASPEDTSFRNTAAGTSASPSVTSAAPPSVNPEFCVGVVWTCNGQAETFTQDGNHPWSTPFDYAQFNGADQPQIFGGNLTTTQTSSTLTYAPTPSRNQGWAAGIFGFIPVLSFPYPRRRTVFIRR